MSAAATEAAQAPEFTETELGRFALLRRLMIERQNEVRQSYVLARVYAQQAVDAADDDLLIKVEQERELHIAYMRDGKFALERGDAVAAADAIAKLQRGMAFR